MKSRNIVLVIAILALAGFAAAAYIYNSSREAAAPAAQAQGPNASAPLAPLDAGPTGTPAAALGAPPPGSVPAVEAAGALTPPPASVPRDNALVRAYSPSVGPVAAKVTIVEFFDPACEACRAFYPIVKQTMAQYPGDVRLVLRYAPLHQGSDEAVRILETARLQNVFIPVLEALLARQPEWAAHGSMDLDRAWTIAGDAGLDLTRARQARMAPKITAALNQDIQDLATVGVSQTPTFFVNGKPLQEFGVQPFQDLVRGEVAAAR
jgi:protein-disulfide isomerase